MNPFLISGYKSPEYFDNKLVDNYRELVTSLQFKILKATAREKVVEKPYSNEFIRKYKLNSASSVKTSIEILLKKGILTQQHQEIYVNDLFFSMWLARQL